MVDAVLATIRRFRWQEWALVAICAGALVFAGWHLVGAARHASQLASHRRDPIAPWMTVGHVAHAYHVAPAVLEQALGTQPGGPDRRPLRVIAKQRGESFETLQATLLEAIQRAGGSVPGTGTPGTGTSPARPGPARTPAPGRPGGPP
jgi:hypothetical protein